MDGVVGQVVQKIVYNPEKKWTNLFNRRKDISYPAEGVIRIFKGKSQTEDNVVEDEQNKDNNKKINFTDYFTKGIKDDKY